MHKSFRSIKILSLVMLLLCCSSPLNKSQAQIPIGIVFDVPLQVQNGITLATELLMQFLLRKEEGLVGIISDINEFFKKAETLVNGAIKNMRMIRGIIDTYQDIMDLYENTLEALDTPIGPADSLLELEEGVIEKWKHLQILLGITKKASNVLELFSKIIEDDTLTIDDKGRVQLIHTIYQDMRRTRSAMRIEVRRINKEIYKYQRTKNEIIAFEKIFE